MQAHGYRILPVNPHETEILGEPAVASLAELREPVDVVDVFRPADEAPAIAQAAVDLGARYLWLQTGIVSEEARSIAEAGGLIGRDGPVHRDHVRRPRPRPGRARVEGRAAGGGSLVRGSRAHPGMTAR